MAESTVSQFPASKPPNWRLFCTGGLLATGGLGYLLRLAYPEVPKEAMTTYLVGSAGVCLTQFSLLPLLRSKLPNWSLMFGGGIIYGAGFGHCYSTAVKEHPKFATLAYMIGTLGYILLNTAIYLPSEAIFKNGGKFNFAVPRFFSKKKRESCKGNFLVCQCPSCAEARFSVQESFQQTVNEVLEEMNADYEKRVSEETSVHGLFREIKEASSENNKSESDCRGGIEKSRSTDENTQTQANDSI